MKVCQSFLFRRKLSHNTLNSLSVNFYFSLPREFFFASCGLDPFLFEFSVVLVILLKITSLSLGLTSCCMISMKVETLS